MASRRRPSHWPSRWSAHLAPRGPPRRRQRLHRRQPRTAARHPVLIARRHRGGTSPAARTSPPPPVSQTPAPPLLSSPTSQSCRRPSALPPPAAAPTFKLNAPMRLNLAVRDALAAIVSTSTGRVAQQPLHPSRPVCSCRWLNWRSVACSLRWRSGAGRCRPAGACRRDGPATVTADFRGEPTIGLVVAPACIDGFDPAAFEPAAHEEPLTC